MTAERPLGKVYLIGAGPGDPGLITLRGVDCLKRAEVLLYDYLVNPRIIEHAPADAERIRLGRHGRERVWTQAAINRQMVESARAGKIVVRLKGGDPLVFGRMAEEQQALIAQGIPFEIVPGVSSGLAAGSYTGIPLTHRELASAVALVTGQECHAKAGDSLDYEALARFPGTLVFYMGVTTAAHWSAALIRAGKPAETPVAIVRKCTLPEQRTIRCRLDQLGERLRHPSPVRPPAVVIVGAVAAAEHALAWFEQRPFSGQTVLVTRPAEQAGELADMLTEIGADVWVQPAIAISRPSDWGPVDRAIERLDRYDWLVFSSVNGVTAFLNRMLGQADLRRLGGCRLAAIGPGTAAALDKYHLRADCLPEEYRAESLAAALAPQASGQRFLLVRASRGREVLAETLHAAGGKVEQVVAYVSSDVREPGEAIRQRLVAGRIDWITVTSSAIARSLIAMFGDELARSKLATISPITSGVLRDGGFAPAVEAREYTMEGLVAAMRAAL